MTFEKKTPLLNLSAAELLSFLQEMKNYEQLMPDETKEFQLLDSNQGFKVTFGNMPRVTLKKQEIQPEAGVSFESPNPAFEYYLHLNVEAEAEQKSKLHLHFDGRLNALIEMMAKKPLEHFLSSIMQKLEQKFAH